MAKTKIRGNQQILDLTIENAQIAEDAAIETSKLAEGAELIKRDGSVVITGDFNFDSNKIINLPVPSQDTEAARKFEVDAEASARAAADTSLSNRLDILEALESEEVFTYDTLASFPESGQLSKIYIAEDENKIYHWKSVAGTETFDHTVGSGGDFATLSEALADASVVNGNKIKILNGTYDLSSQILIDKEVQIFGESKDGVILQSSADTSAPTTLISVTANNVALVDLTVKHRKTNNTSVETAVSVSGSGFPQTRVDGFVMSNCRIEHVEFGVVVRGSNHAIVDCEISYEGPSNSTRRAIGLYGNLGESFILRNTFLNNLSSGNLRAITLTSTTGTNPDETYEGSLIVEDNVHSGALQQFISMDSFQEGASKFDLIVKRNITNESSAFISLYSGTVNFADIFNKIVVEANNISNVHSSTEGTGKGLIGLDGWGADVDISTNPLPIESLNNILSQLNFRSDYQEIAGSSGSIVGGKIGAIVGDVTVSSTVSATPSEPSYPSLAGGSSSSYVELSPQVDLTEIISDISEEEAARIAGDASTLASAQTYADTAVANLVDSAPELLDTLNELAAALGDDPNFATTVAGQVAAVQTNLDAEESARVAADTALQGEVDAVEAALAQELLDRAAGDAAVQANLDTEEAARIAADDLILEYKPDQIIYVSKNGDDSNVGSEHLPFLTIGGALSSITDASPTKRYALRVSSGEYVEASLELKPNVFIVGETAKEAVRINSTISLDSSFDGSEDNRSGLANVLVLGACDFDWNAVTSAAGKLYFSQTVFGSTVNLNGYNNAIAQSQFADCQFFGKLTVSGINVSVFHNNICWSDVELTQHPNGGMATIFNAVGGTISGELRATTTVDDFGRRCSAFLKSCFTGQIVIDGIKSYVDATNDSIPSAGATIVNNGNLVRLNDAGVNKDLSNLTFPTAVNQPIMPANTNSTNFGDWGKQWFWNFGYIHASSGTDLYVISYGASYGADSEGKNIILLADGAGLQENVDGGNISLATAAVSGTGVRGKIQLDGSEIDVTSKQVKNLADATDATDAVTKQQLDAEISALNVAGVAIANVVTRENPSGSVDGSNVEFTVSETPIVGTEHVYVNGLLQEPGASEDYTISGSTITFASAPESGERIRVSYIKQS